MVFFLKFKSVSVFGVFYSPVYLFSLKNQFVWDAVCIKYQSSRRRPAPINVYVAKI